MTKNNNSNLWIADENKTFVRKSDNVVMGSGIDLGVDDSIDNYEEVELTEDNDIEGKLKAKEDTDKSKRVRRKQGK